MLAFCQVNVLNEYDDDDDVRKFHIHNILGPSEKQPHCRMLEISQHLYIDDSTLTKQ